MIQVRLMNQDAPFCPVNDLKSVSSEILSDLRMIPVLESISKEDAIVRSSLESALRFPLTDAESIRYRQDVLSDALRLPTALRSLYQIVLDALSAQQREDLRFYESQSITQQFQCCKTQLSILVDYLKALGVFSRENGANFSSSAFLDLFHNIDENFDSTFFSEVDDLLKKLAFPHGMMVGARLSSVGTICDLRLLSNVQNADDPDSQSNLYRLQSGDASGFSDILHRKEVVLCDANRTLLRAVLHITDFLQQLRIELAFFIGCLNFTEMLAANRMPFCIPHLAVGRAGNRLTETNTALTNNQPVENTFDFTDKHACIITGADQGGKTTFLIAIGQAQLFLQCGFPVAAESFCAPITNGVFAHFQKDEDRSMRNGKLNEELNRMSKIIDQVRPASLVLFDESFCSTNDREGSKIALDITRALLAHKVDVISVTHLYPFAKTLFDEHNPAYAFLCAERLPDGTRTKRMISGEPLPTSFGLDVYVEVFGVDSSAGSSGD